MRAALEGKIEAEPMDETNMILGQIKDALKGKFVNQ